MGDTCLGVVGDGGCGCGDMGAGGPRCCGGGGGMGGVRWACCDAGHVDCVGPCVLVGADGCWCWSCRGVVLYRVVVGAVAHRCIARVVREPAIPHTYIHARKHAANLRLAHLPSSQSARRVQRGSAALDLARGVPRNMPCGGHAPRPAGRPRRASPPISQAGMVALIVGILMGDEEPKVTSREEAAIEKLRPQSGVTDTRTRVTMCPAPSQNAPPQRNSCLHIGPARTLSPDTAAGVASDLLTRPLNSETRC